MTAKQVTIRNAVYDAVDNAKLSYVIPDTELEKTYYPQEDLEDLGAKPKIKFIAVGLGAERNRQIRHAGVVMLDLPVQIAVQQRVDRTATSTIDNLVELVEEIQATCEDDDLVTGENYNWQRTDPLKDENDLIYSYEQLTTQGVFQSIFTVHYQYIRQP